MSIKIEDTFVKLLRYNRRFRDAGILLAWAYFRERLKRDGWEYIAKVPLSKAKHYPRSSLYDYRFIDMAIVVPSTREPIIGVFRKAKRRHYTYSITNEILNVVPKDGKFHSLVLSSDNGLYVNGKHIKRRD